MQQGQPYIPIVGFPDPNYSIKAVNQNKLSSPIMNSPLAPLYVTQRPLSFMFVDPNTEFYIPDRRQFSTNFKNKVNNSIWGQLPLSKQKRAKGCFRFYYKETSFWNSDYVNVTGVQQRSWKQHQFYKKINFTTSHFQGFSKEV